MKIKPKLILLAMLLVLLPSVLVGIIGYRAAETAFYDSIELGLENQVKVARQFVYTFEGDEPAVIAALDTIPVGKTGYFSIYNGNGTVVTTRNKGLVGKDVSQIQDTNGKYFIQEILSEYPSLGPGEVGYVTYFWKNPGEEAGREKIVAFTYIPEKDWLILPGTYVDEFEGEGSLAMVRNSILAVVLLSLLVGLLLAFLLAQRIATPVKRLTEAGKRIADGDLEAEIPAIKTGDEVEELSTTMALLVGAVKFLKADKAPKAEAPKAGKPKK